MIALRRQIANAKTAEFDPMDTPVAHVQRNEAGELILFEDGEDIHMGIFVNNECLVQMLQKRAGDMCQFSYLAVTDGFEDLLIVNVPFTEVKKEFSSVPKH